MENFRKVRSEEATAVFGTEGGGPGPFADLALGAVHMPVKEGSKIRNLLAFAAASMAQPDMRAIIFSGCTRATTKMVTYAEILKRRLAGLHQVTRLCYQNVREVWQSLPPGPTPRQKHSLPGACLSVLENVPSLTILLSKDTLDPRQPGYQSPSSSSDPSYLPMVATSKRSLGEPAVAEGSSKGFLQAEPRAAEEDLTA